MKPVIGILTVVIVCTGPAAGQLAAQSLSATSEPAGGQATTMPATAPAATQPATTQPAAKKEDDKISVSFKDMSVEQVASFLGEKLGKPVLLSEEVKKKKINILCKEKKTLAMALMLIRQALLDQGIMVEELDGLIRLRPVGEAMQARLQRVPADVSVATIEDKLKIVAKEFLVLHYDVQKMVSVIQPMLPSFGHVMADPDSGRLVITDTVGNVQRIELIIQSIDVPMAERTVTEIIEVTHGDASEIVAIIRWLIAGKMGIHVKEITTTGGTTKEAASKQGSSGPSRGQPPKSPPKPGAAPGGKSPPQAGVTQIEPSTTPVTLVPHVSRNWIIAVAPAEIMVQIKIWVQQLDKPREVEKDYELYDVKHASVDSVAQRIQSIMQAMPNVELRQSTHVVPFTESKKLIVFGSKTGRDMVADLLKKLDTPSADRRKKRTFALKHADAEEMAERIEKLFSAMRVDSRYDYGYGSSTRYRRSSDVEDVSVVPDKRRNAITVITDAKTMDEIAELIRQEDTPIDPGDVKPNIYELRYVDPGEMRDLLTDMFSEKESSRSFWDIFYGSSSKTTKAVGRLLGHFSFQVLASTNKLVVISKSVADYQVIDALIAELDQPQRAGLPLLVELKYANSEDLCEQLNAMLAEPGTLAKVRRADRGLSDYRSGSSSRSGQDDKSDKSSGDSKDSQPGMMEFWWQGFRRPQGQIPTSNLVGKIRIVPVYRRNAVMVLAPEGYKEQLKELIEQLDQPGRQVMIRACIGEIQHDDQTTLGLRIASDSSILSPADTALGGSVTGQYQDVFGGTLTLGASVNLTALINLLVREFDMKILLQPTLTTSDNQASQYFDGQDVSVQTELRQSSEGTSTVTGFEYQEVGTRLRVRPHITQKGNVDLIINLEISRIVPGSESQGNPTFDRREVTTHVIVSNSQTIMLSGIIRQQDFDDVRKVPLLGDLWLIGPLFRSIDKGIRNREMVIFITPCVMTTPEDVDEQMVEPLKSLGRVKEALGRSEASYRPDMPAEATP